MNTDWPILKVSTGDMALAMMGVKTRHIASVRPPKALNGHAILECELNGQVLRYPIVMDAHRPVKRDYRIPPKELGAYGHTMEKARQPGEIAEPSTPREREKYERFRLGYSASALLKEQKRFEPLDHYSAVDIAKKKRWLYDIEFHLPSAMELADPAQIKEARHLAAQASVMLQKELLQTRSFLRNDVGASQRYGGMAAKLSMQRAVVLLDTLGISDETTTNRRFATATSLVSKARHAVTPTPKPVEPAFPDGKGEAYMLAASESADISVGTACQLYMKFVRHAVLKHRPQGAIRGAEEGTDYVEPQAMRLAAQSKPSTSGHIRHHIDLPMKLELSEERTIDILEMTDFMAHDLGYADLKALRQELGIKKGQSCELYIYPVTLTPVEELPFDRDRTGSRLNGYRRDLLDAWKSPDPTVRRAKKHTATLKPEMQREGYLRLADQNEMTANELKGLINRNGTRPVPNDVRAEIAHSLRAPMPDPAPAVQADVPSVDGQPVENIAEETKTPPTSWELRISKGRPGVSTGEEASNDGPEEPGPARLRHDAQGRLSRRAKVQGARTEAAFGDDIEEVRAEMDGGMINRRRAEYRAEAGHPMLKRKKHPRANEEPDEGDPLKSRPRR